MDNLIIAHLYQPGSAATNRIFAYAIGFACQGVNVSLILGNKKSYEAPLLKNENKIIVDMVRAPHGYTLNKAMANKVKALYKDGSTAILIYGTPALCWFLPKSKYNIFYECTEVPFYGRKKTLSSWLKEEVKDFLIRRATGMLVISKALANYYTNKGIKNVAIINMFVDSQRFENIKVETKEKYIAYCGTISSFKDGVDCLINAFAIFAALHDDFRLKIVGRFESDEAENTLKELVDNLNLGDKVDFTGMVTPCEMPQILCGAQLLALARPNNEQAKFGFPTKLGEYLATGKPVVVTDVGEIGNFLVDGVNCRMANPDDEVDFADKMSWVADHEKEARMLGEQGWLLTQKEFSALEQSKRALAFMEAISF